MNGFWRIIDTLFLTKTMLPVAFFCSTTAIYDDKILRVGIHYFYEGNPNDGGLNESFCSMVFAIDNCVFLEIAVHVRLLKETADYEKT